MLIAWQPGRQLLETGSIDPDYPYPAWTVVAMLPIIIWEPYTSMIIWYICNLIMMGVSIVVFIRLMGWEIPLYFYPIFVILIPFFLPVLSSFWLGQLTIFSLLMLVLAAYSLKNRHFSWLGLVLGLSFIKPQLAAPLAGFLLLWALIHRRWSTLIWFGVVIGALVIISIPAVESPMQIIGGGINSHLNTYIDEGSTLFALFAINKISLWIPTMISAVLAGWLFYIWIPALRNPEPAGNYLYLFSATVMVNLIILPYSWLNNFALTIFPYGYGLMMAAKFNLRARAYSFLAFLAIMYPITMVMFQYFYFFGKKTQAYQIVPVLLMLPVLYFVERKSRQTTLTNSGKISPDLP